MRKLAFITVLAVCAPSMSAQRAFSSPHFALPRATPAASRFVSGPGFGANARFNRGRFPGSLLDSLALFSDPLYTDAFYSSGYPVASQPPVIILQAPAAADSAPAQPAASVQPLMIELRGDRYVRVNGEALSDALTIDPEAGAGGELATSRLAQQPITPRNAPPVVLVFRDGRREEVSDYTIADGVLYACANYYTEGAWNKEIKLSSLNLSETVAFNDSRGVRFRVPASPNEVIVGP